MSEKNLLKYIKDNNLKHDDVIALIKANNKVLKTREEIRDELKAETEAAKEKVEKELALKKAAEEKAKADADKEGEPETDDIKKQLADLTKEVKDLREKGITRKTPSKGKKTEEEDLPESVTYKIQKNMFEVDV